MGWFSTLKRAMGRAATVVKRVGQRAIQVLSNKTTVGFAELTPDERLYFDVARASYATNRPPVLSGLQLQGQHSDASTAVYFDTSTRRLVIGFRGSKTLSDWIETNPLIAVGAESSTQRFQADVSRYDRIRTALNPTSTVVVGHSMGGAVALYINRVRTPSFVCVVNPAFNLNSFRDTKTANVLILRTRNDPVSALASVSGFAVKTVRTTFDDSTSLSDVLKSHRLDAFSP